MTSVGAKRIMASDTGANKKPRTTTTTCPSRSDSAVKRDILNQWYPSVEALREHLISRLPVGSRLRKKKIASIGLGDGCTEIEVCLANLLDTTLVCSDKREQEKGEVNNFRWKQWMSFSQKGDESCVTISGTGTGIADLQSEIVDFVIWQLFSRERSKVKNGPSWPKHILCDGFRRTINERDQANNNTTIPGIFSRFPNSHVKTLKEAPWTQVLALLGQSGERVMIDLLSDCSIFVAINAGFGNYYQLSGFPVSESDFVAQSAPIVVPVIKPVCRKPSEIVLVRSRIFYAKPALTARGHVQAGFKHIHALNRFTYHGEPQSNSTPHLKMNGDTPLKLKNEINTKKLMMYIFPRQFGLHNVFTSEVDRTRTAQKFQDYTLREEEISSIKSGKPNVTNLAKYPKRLRGAAKCLVERLQIRHSRCSYSELLRHYCPSMIDSPAGTREAAHNPATERDLHTSTCARVGVASAAAGQYNASQRRTKPRKYGGRRRPQPHLHQPPMPQLSSLTELACPNNRVSVFCQAVLSKLIPDGFWGEGKTREHNKRMFLRKVDGFIKLRRFETMSLHEISQEFKIVDILWLQQPHFVGQKTSQTDIDKRHEIFHEFLYYVFDSLLMPLIRSNFFVTESSSHRYHLLYFRHDVWKRIAEPAMITLKETMFEEVRLADATRILNSRSLGVSQIRLLPKGKTVRPIMNLRRRALGMGSSKVLGPSINSILAPVYTMLKLEKDVNPSRLGASIFSVNDIYTKLKEFRRSLDNTHEKLYFAKVDVQAAFDTIPQDAVIRLMVSVPQSGQYTMTKHVEVTPGQRSGLESGAAPSKPVRRWHSTALGPSKTNASNFHDRLEEGVASKKKNTLFVDSAMQKGYGVVSLLTLLAEHVTQNLVKIGKKYYRQKKGIPQGSVLSSFLCNYFYADLEMNHLSFLSEPDCLVLRLTDDFLVITTDKSKAVRFVEIMLQGIPEYGVAVSRQKTLVNFDMETSSQRVVTRVDEGAGFPYCGTLIDCKTLEITRDYERAKTGGDVRNSLTVSFGRSPGQTFQQKVLGAFKIQSHYMYFDTTHNSISTVLETLYGAFCETANKMWAYIGCLPKPKRPKKGLVIRTIVKVTDVAFMILTGKSRQARYEDYSCDVRKVDVTITGYKAFLEVLSRKRSGYEDVIAWLQDEISKLKGGRTYK